MTELTAGDLDLEALRPEVRRVVPYRFTATDARVKLDQNESPYPPPPAAAAAMRRVLDTIELNRYPDVQPLKLHAALAGLHGWSGDGITVSAGSNVLIQALVIAAGLGRRVLTVTPTFAVYSLQAQLLGAELTEVPLNHDFSLPVDQLVRELQQGSGVLFIAAPAAPTGNLPGRDELLALKRAAADRWLFVIDEAYHLFAGSDFSELARADNVVVLRTLSKAAGLAGLRLGYALSSPAVASQLRKVLLPFSVSALQQELALAVIEHQDELRASVETLISERRRLSDGLARLAGVTVYPSQANFVLFRVADAAAIHAQLLEHGVLVRRQDHLPGLSGCLRVSAGLPSENSEFLAALAAIMTVEGVMQSDQ